MTHRLAHPHHWTVFAQIAGFFALSQVIALLAVSRVTETGVLGYPRHLQWGEILIGFAIVTLVLLVLIQKSENEKILRGFFGFAIFAASTSIFLVFFPLLLAFVFGILAALWCAGKGRVGLQNLALLFAAAGVEFTIGITASWRTLALVLILLGFYDIIAVYGTEHMVMMVKKLLARHAAAALIIPENIRGWWARTDRVTMASGYLLIGTGDVALPGALTVAASLVDERIGLGTLLGGLVGLFITHFLFYEQKNKKSMPALPIIVVGCLVGLAVARVVIA